MRNPNGFGCPVKLSGNRRNPYGARKTIGFKENGQPIYKFIGYYPTRKEAMIALGEYNSNPENFVTKDSKLTPINKITLRRVYDEWGNEHFQTLKSSAHYRSAIKVVEPLYDISITQLKINDFEQVFKDSQKNYDTLKVTRIALKLMYQFAFRKGYINEAAVNIPTFISLELANKVKRSERRPFTHDEISTLWEHKDDDGVQIVLFMIYTGLRISEVVKLKSEDVYIDDRYFVVKDSKTEAGIRRVPIANKIYNFVEKWYSESREYLVPLGGNKYSVKIKPNFNGFNDAISKYLTEKHEQHETRYTCATLLTEAGVDDRLIKLIVGHASQDVTNRVYAKKVDIKILLEAINRI